LLLFIDKKPGIKQHSNMFKKLVITTINLVMVCLAFLGVLSLFVTSNVLAAESKEQCATTHGVKLENGKFSEGDYSKYLVCMRKNGLTTNADLNCSALFDQTTDKTKYTICRVMKDGKEGYLDGGCTVFSVDLYTGGINVENEAFKTCQKECLAITDAREKSNCTQRILVQNKLTLFREQQQLIRNECAQDMKVPTGFAIFNIANVIPVIPGRCFSTALGLELLPNAIGRLYAFIAGIGIYLITTGIIINGVYWVVSGIDNEYNTTTLLKNIRSLFFSVFILLVISTLLLNILNTIGYDSTNSNSQTGTGIIFK
jgi:hypothetical protein